MRKWEEPLVEREPDTEIVLARGVHKDRRGGPDCEAAPVVRCSTMRRFRGYRRTPPQEYCDQGVANAPDEVQYEGVIFSDGTVCVRWLTAYRSHAIWADFATFWKIHGHPEYGTEIEWLDGPPNAPIRASRSAHAPGQSTVCEGKERPSSPTHRNAPRT